MLEAGNEVILTTDYEFKGSAEKIAVSYPDLAKDVEPGSKILCADGSVTFTVLECDVAKGEEPLVEAEAVPRVAEDPSIILERGETVILRMKLPQSVR